MNYEITVVLDGKVTPAKKKSVTEDLKKLTDLYKGKLGKAKEWGRIDLAYPIGRSATGVFLHFPLELETSAVKNLTDKLRLEKDIIRYLIVKKEN